MKRKAWAQLYLAIGLLALLAMSEANAQSAPAALNLPEGKPVILPRAAYFDLRSKAGIDYRIFVAGPTGEVPAAGAPVIYLSDGNGNFPIVLAAAQRQLREGQPCVVVGIGYATEDRQLQRQLRSFDLTPPTSAEWARANAKPFADLKTGGQDQFLDFIENELKPIIEKQFKVDRQRQTLFGHSFGGLFALHVMFTRPEAFQNYIAASPSLWWNDGSIMQEERQFTERSRDQKVSARLLLTVGQLEQPAPIAHANPPARPGPPGNGVDSLKKLAERLTAAKVEGLIVESRIFAEEHHGSVVLPAASRGVRFALDDRK